MRNRSNFTDREVLYYWSQRRQAYIVYSLGILQPASYPSVRAIHLDWPFGKFAKE